MASSQSAGGSSSMSRSRSGSQLPQLRCYHDEVAPIRVVKHHGPTLGKRFYGCGRWPRTCGFFKWVDEPDEVTELQFRLFEKDTEISQLEMEKQMLDEKVRRLKQTNLKIQDQVEELALENSVVREGLYSAKADKKMSLLFIFSWIFLES
ncbi:Protein ZGRF1 [Bienertia sinuspersici]